MPATAIEVKDVSFFYNGHPILAKVNLTVGELDFLAIMGPNGSGKTTLFKIILGILNPAQGSVRIFGKTPREAAGLLGYVPQDTGLNKDFPISVFDVALMGRLGRTGLSRRFTSEDRELARKVLEQVGMWDFRDRQIGKLSGGQRQRVFIARALSVEPKILLMDEPTASVDAQFQTDLYSLLKELNSSITVVVVSHDVSVLSGYINSVACLNRTLFYHGSGEVTEEMLHSAYQCPVDLIAHGGVPHRVLRKHDHKDS
ncbi:Manganese transport system ATP-binding protein MntA [Syntrophobacter sp. SbD1]|nr:Manganese transport system ATP-binding protein MntA [Syntrophobacter sp. SbD1]